MRISTFDIRFIRYICRLSYTCRHLSECSHKERRLRTALYCSMDHSDHEEESDGEDIPSSPSYHEMMDLLEDEEEEQIMNGLQIEYPLDSMEDLHLNPEGNLSDEGIHEVGDIAIPPAAREHTYLPGITSALFPEEWLLQGRPAQLTESSSHLQSHTDNEDLDFGIAPIATRSTVTSLIQVPILELEGVVTFPHSTVPLRFESREWIRYLKTQIDRAKSGEETRVQVGILTKAKKRRRRRRGSEGDNVRGPTGGRMGRWNLAMIRRGMLRSTRRRGEDGSPVDDVDNSVEFDSGTGTTGNSGVGANQMLATEFLYPTTPPKNPPDPLIGRIGTFATITYIQERDDDMENEIIVTASTTSRFRIVSLQTECDYQENARDTSVQCLLYNVEHLYDENVRLPASLSQRNVAISQTGSGRHDFIPDLNKLTSVTGLPIFSYLTAWPVKLVLDIVEEIFNNDAFRGLQKSIPSSSGLFEKENGNTVYESDKAISKNQIDPQHFSFWLSSNLPLSEYDKLELLEMNHVADRLKFILDYMKKQRKIVHYLKCKQCGAQIAQTTDIFTLDGAEGTTGAYVNEYGVIHQTITLRNIGNTRCIGGSETKDSWFPGYAWTIAYCSLCASHLGWKFHLVNRRSESGPDRPATFWGVSGSNVTTSTASPSLQHLHSTWSGTSSP